MTQTTSKQTAQLLERPRVDADDRAFLEPAVRQYRKAQLSSLRRSPLPAITEINNALTAAALQNLQPRLTIASVQRTRCRSPSLTFLRERWE
jgi:hypothetical protein